MHHISGWCEPPAAAIEELAPSLCFVLDTGYQLPHAWYFLRKRKNSIRSSSRWKIVHEFAVSKF